MKQYQSLRTLIFLACLSLATSLTAQDKVLFTYGDQKVGVEEFQRVFLKNNQKEMHSDSSIRAYLNLYINFKLKVAEAKALKMDTASEFINELKGYRSQLAKNYLVDTSITHQLVKEAYERLQNEVKASHIMVELAPNALPKDTMAAYKKAENLRKRVLVGEAFDSVAYKESSDRSAQYNFGNLGYFSAFDMIYAFENMAFNTPVGQLSPVFRTQFGYHFLKVTDKRSNRGEVKVAHLMITIEPTAPEEIILKGKRKADSIYAKLQNGAEWNEMVKQFTDDPNGVKTGGELDWISSLARLPEAFKDAAFAMNNVGEISLPVKTEFGWHIIKFLEKRAVKSFDESKEKLRNQIAREPERSKLNRKALVEKLKKENGFENNLAAFQSFAKSMDSTILKGNFQANQLKNSSTKLFRIGTKWVDYASFAQYLEQYQTTQQGKSISDVTKQMFEDFTEQQILQYEEDNLENKYPAFGYLMQEYYDGILLFNLTEKEVWNKAIEDTVGLKNYHELNKLKHLWADRVSATTYDCADKATYTLVRKLIKKKTDDADIANMVNKANPLSLVIKRGKYQKGENQLIDGLKWKKGITYIDNKNGSYTIARITEILPAGAKTLNEVKGIMTGEYQNVLEENWIATLKTKFPVKINEVAVKSIMN